MNTMKTVLALSITAAGAVGAAHAATVGTFSSVSITGGASSIDVGGPITGSGTAVLDDNGTLTVTDSQLAMIAVFPQAPTATTTGDTSIFTGTYTGSVFTGTAGSSRTTSCIGALCNFALNFPTANYLTVAGSVAASSVGGTLTTTIPEFAGTVRAIETWTFSGFEAAPVPLPPAAWLLGSGLLGLIGSARRRRAVKAS